MDFTLILAVPVRISVENRLRGWGWLSDLARKDIWRILLLRGIDRLRGRAAEMHIIGGEKAYAVGQIRRQYPKAYARWTEEEDRSLREAWEQGKMIGELAGQFGKQPGAIQSRLRKLGLA